MMGTLLIESFCTDCGFTKAQTTSTESDRCTSCGKFVSQDPDVCCAKHELKTSPYNNDHCPRCEEERRIRAEERHMHTRDPMVEPY